MSNYDRNSRSNHNNQGGRRYHNQSNTNTNDHHNKRSRHDSSPAPTPEQRIKTIILACGDSKDQTISQIQVCVAALSTDCVKQSSETPSSATINETIAEFTLQCLIHALRAMPTRVNIYSTVLALLDQSIQKSTGQSIREKALTSINDMIKLSINQCQHDEIRVMIRLMIGLANVRLINRSDVWSTLRTIITWIEQSNNQFYRDFYLYTLLTLVPWLAIEENDESVNQSNKQTFDEFVQTLHSTIESRVSLSVDQSMVMNSANEDGTPVSEDTVALLEAAIWKAHRPIKTDQSMDDADNQSNNDTWCRDLISRPHLVSLFSTQLATVEPSSFTPFDNTTAPALSQPNSQSNLILPPALSIFSSDQWTGETVRYAPYSLARFMMLDYMRDCLIIFEAVHKEGAKQLLALPSKIDYSPLLIESLLSHMFMLPRPSVPAVYYGTVLIDLFKAEPAVMPAALGLAVNNIFERLDELEIECFDRLIDWFSFHLSNFAYAWPWVNWSAVLETDEFTPQRIFVREVFAKITRLSFWARIQQTIPEELLPLMPDQPAPAFRFASNAMSDEQSINQSKLQPQADKLVTMLREKQPSDAVLEFLQSIASSGSETELSHPVQLLMPCLLHCGDKSFSHLFALFDRYADVLTRTLSQGDDAQVHMMDSLGEFWQHSHQHQSIIADQLMQRSLLEPQYLLQWALNQPSATLHHRYVWENVGLALNHCETLGINKPEQCQESLNVLFSGMSRLLKVHAANEGLEAILEARTKALSRHYHALIAQHSNAMSVQEALQSSDSRVQAAVESMRVYE